MIFEEFPPVSYADWEAQAGACSKILWGPADVDAASPPQPWPEREWEMLEEVPEGLFALDESADAIAQLRVAVASGASAFLVPVGTQYFIEIAKLRALRRLSANPVRIVAITEGPDPQTMQDPHLNLVRSTTCAMSAIAGGCDALIVRPMDDTELGRRLARNTQHLLREEAHFGETRDVAAGSWYLEALTARLVDAAAQ